MSHNMADKSITNRQIVAELRDHEIDYQIKELIEELRSLDRLSLAFDGAIEDLKDLFSERRFRRTRNV